MFESVFGPQALGFGVCEELVDEVEGGGAGVEGSGAGVEGSGAGVEGGGVGVRLLRQVGQELGERLGRNDVEVDALGVGEGVEGL